jgi:mRNA-degrading endonuclease YafQ of YafQ-DinJ toxin-antitoxin module
MEEQPVSIQVDMTVKFQKKVKDLEKKYRDIKNDLRSIIESLQTAEYTNKLDRYANTIFGNY